MKRLAIIMGFVAALAVTVQTLARGIGGGHAGGSAAHMGGFSGGHTPSFSGGAHFGGAAHIGGFSSGHTPSFGGGLGRPSFARPQPAMRPSFVPQSRPAFAQRPNLNRPANQFARPSFALGGSRIASNSRSTIVNRPILPEANREFGIGSRPGIIAGNRPTWASARPGGRGALDRGTWAGDRRPAINGNRNWASNRNWSNYINSWANRNRYWTSYATRPWTRPWYNHYDWWHHGWHHGYWNYWQGGYPWVWLGLNSLGWWGWPGADYAYSNPYYVAPLDTGDVYYPDYSQPIPAPAEEPPVDANIINGAEQPEPQSAAQEDPNAQQAMDIFDTARSAFQQGDYATALARVDDAIQLLPSDTALHEFRAACLFALKRYQEAAAGIYAVLAAGPGWNWETMKDLYPNSATYTAQLRALEDYKKANPEAPDASFLLAYEYLVLGYPDAAFKELQQVARLQPDDKLASALVDALRHRDASTNQTPVPNPM